MGQAVAWIVVVATAMLIGGLALTGVCARCRHPVAFGRLRLRRRDGHECKRCVAERGDAPAPRQPEQGPLTSVDAAWTAATWWADIVYAAGPTAQMLGGDQAMVLAGLAFEARNTVKVPDPAMRVDFVRVLAEIIGHRLAVTDELYLNVDYSPCAALCTAGDAFGIDDLRWPQKTKMWIEQTASRPERWRITVSRGYGGPATDVPVIRRRPYLKVEG